MAGFFQSLWYILLDMSLWFLVGLLIAGILHVVVKQDAVIRYVGQNNFRSVLWAALVGVPLPLCSCGVIPTGVSLRKNGASSGATVSFLIATPQTGVDSIGVTWSLLGAPFAIIRPFVALISGLIGGAATNILAPNETTASHGCPTTTTKKHSILYRIMRYSLIEFLEDISLWMIIGLLLSALIGVLVPNDFFTHYINNYWLSLLIVLVIAVPLYVCATGSVPIAAALLAKGLSPGAALVFLMAGPATNAATITVLSKTLGKRTTIIYVSTIVLSSLFFAIIIDSLLPTTWFAAPQQTAAHCHTPTDTFTDWLAIGSAILISSLLLYHTMKKFIQRIIGTPALAENANEIAVTDISCNKCKAKIEQHLLQIEGIETVDASVAQKKVTFTGTASKETVSTAIENLGYTVKK